jgi:hypothetical protein
VTDLATAQNLVQLLERTGAPLCTLVNLGVQVAPAANGASAALAAAEGAGSAVTGSAPSDAYTVAAHELVAAAANFAGVAAAYKDIIEGRKWRENGSDLDTALRAAGA